MDGLPIAGRANRPQVASQLGGYAVGNGWAGRLVRDVCRGSGVSYSAQLFVAVAPVTEGLPGDQRAAMLTIRRDRSMGKERFTNDQTAPLLPVGSQEYRRVVAAVTLADLT